MYGIYGIIYLQYTPNVSIYTIHGSYGYILYSLQKWSNESNVMFDLQEGQEECASLSLSRSLSVHTYTFKNKKRCYVCLWEENIC